MPDESSRSKSGAGQRILVSGATGLIGRNFVQRRRAMGDTVVPLVRGEAGPDAIRWSPGSGTLNPESVSGFDAVVHLAGEPVVGRWTAEKKRRILDSRVAGTVELASALARAAQPPRVFVCASGINFYGNAADRSLDENSPRGSGFLAEVTQAWEAAAHPLEGVARVVKLRIGVVLTPQGGTLGAMLPIFRSGLGGTFGGGAGYVSWLSLDDLMRAIDFVTTTETLAGAVNAVSPQPVTGKEFTSALAAAVHRPAVFGVPAWAARLMLGELAEDTVLGSVRALPAKLTEAGFLFHDNDVRMALQKMLG